MKRRTTEDRQEGDDVAGNISQAMRTSVSKSSYGYLIAEDSKTGERRTGSLQLIKCSVETISPTTAGLHTLSLKVLNWTLQCITTYQRGHTFLTTGTRTTLSTDLSQSRKDPSLVPKASKASLDQHRRTSKHQKATTNTNYSNPTNWRKDTDSSPHAFNHPSIHPSPSVQNSNPIHHHIHIHPKQPNNPRINAPIPSCRPYLTPQLKSPRENQPSPSPSTLHHRQGKD